VSESAAANAETIVAALLRSRVEIAASLPDSWLTAVIERVEAEPRIRHVRVTREDDAVGICAGAALGGKRAVAICQNAGVLLSANALAGYALHHQLPVVVLAAYRGREDDTFAYQRYKGAVTEPVVRDLQLQHHVVSDAAQLAVVEEAFREAELARRPVIVLLKRAALLDPPRPS
jgi:sulfopyruvate decarboxylase subunit alpha